MPSPDRLNLSGALPWAFTLIGISLVAAIGGIEINSHSTPWCNLISPGSEKCMEIPLFMKVPLIGTHMLAFGLIPTSMWTMYKRLPQLKKWGAADPFLAMTGVAFLMVSIAGEVGWHVTQHWYYADEYMILNAWFYLFLVLGTGLWAVGVRDTDDTDEQLGKIVDYGMCAAAPMSMAIYYGAAAGFLPGKWPIFIILTLEYAVLSYRLWKLLGEDNRVWLFPLFSVGVNLGFIYLLDTYGKGNVILNPLFHICHDFLGTEMGVAVITALVWLSPNWMPDQEALRAGKDP